jgi:hypothetical protein
MFSSLYRTASGCQPASSASSIKFCKRSAATGSTLLYSNFTQSHQHSTGLYETLNVPGAVQVSLIIAAAATAAVCAIILFVPSSCKHHGDHDGGAYAATGG